MLRSKTPAKANEIKAAFGLLMLAAVSSTAFAAEWPLFLGTPERNAVLEKTLAPPLELEWSYDATEPIDSTAIVVDGTVYFGDMNGRFHAVDLETGKGKWIYEARLGVPASGCVQDGAVFFGDEEGFFYAVDIATGKARWTFESLAEILSSPNCLPGAVLFGSYDFQSLQS